MEKIREILTRGVVNIIPSRSKLEKLLLSGKKLNVYLGIDPTARRIHLGHAVPLRKIQAFADLGHNTTFLIGDFTALIGDTSDKESERPILTKEEIRQNFKTYKKQASKILDFSKVKVRYNSKWLAKLKLEDIIKLSRHFSLGDFIGRELIRERLNKGGKVRLDEVLYPILQGYDSLFLDTDIQIGSRDQIFNMQAGRTLLKNLKNKDSFVLVTDYLLGPDGKKMSKSLGNAIWLDDPPQEMFGKIMSLDDSLIIKYFELASNVSLERLEEEKRAYQSGENPMFIKKRLAYEIVSEIYSQDKAKSALDFFEKTFQKRAPEYSLRIPLRKDLASTIAPFTTRKSLSEAKRLILQGGVDVNGKVVLDIRYRPSVGDRIKIGQKIFGRIVKE